MKNTILSFSILTLLLGCSNTYMHKKPEPVTVNNEKFINLPQDKVWNMAFNQLFDDTFTIGNVDKKNGIITATFETDRPTNFIDCGIVKASYMDDEKVTHKYTYNYAEATEYSTEKDGERYDAKVDAKLDTTITATIKKMGEGTNIILDVDYALTRTTNLTNHANQTKLPEEKEVITFSSTKPYKNEKFSCISIDAIESGLLNNIHAKGR
ncbi:hypothetical protein DKL61_06095 [Gammaproteobacteria bacterium ESL0073]|nr:hypothetical protein DKL61_06095 [Gammaproteobacteria bacterium ESL0073]